MFSMWSAHQNSVVRLGLILRPSSIQHSYQEQWQRRSPQTATIDSDSNEPTIPHGFGSQHPIVPPKLNYLNLLLNPFNVLATMAVIRPHEENSPQSPEPSIPFPTSTPPMNVSTKEAWDTTHTTTNDATFYTDDGPRRVYWDISSDGNFDTIEPRHVSIASSPSSTLPPPRQQKKKLSIGMSFPEKGECRSTPAMHAANPYQPKRHPNAQGKLKHYPLLTKL